MSGGKLIHEFVNSALMNRLVRFLLLILLAFILIGAVKYLALSRMIILGILFIILIWAIIWVLKKTMK